MRPARRCGGRRQPGAIAILAGPRMTTTSPSPRSARSQPPPYVPLVVQGDLAGEYPGGRSVERRALEHDDADDARIEPAQELLGFPQDACRDERRWQRRARAEPVVTGSKPNTPTKPGATVSAAWL